MMTFFRKHQKVFIAVVAVFTTASFLFFGTYSVIQPGMAIKDHAVGKTVDGKPIMNEELSLLTRFLATSRCERGLFEKGGAPNLLNDGVIQKDFLETGFGVILTEQDFSPIKEDLEAKIGQIKAYRPYAHPQVPFISAQSLWFQFVPDLNRHYAALQSKQTVDIETFILLSALYLDQMQFSPDVLRSVLRYYQGQYQWVSADPVLERGDLSLFGFHTVEDWFGKQFVHHAAQVILNGSVIAKKKGYSVSREEARHSLKANLREGLIQLGKKEVSDGEVEQIYHRQIAALYPDEEKVVAVWQKVLLFRKMYSEDHYEIDLDSLTYTDPASFATMKTKIDLYKIPAQIELRNFQDLMKLQVYLEAISPATQRKSKIVSLGLPVVHAPIEEIARNFPELVQTKFEVEIQTVKKSQLTENIPLKEIYSWELEEGNWAQLVKKFPILKNAASVSIEERYETLEKLARNDRLPIDAFAKEAILRQHPEWVEIAFFKEQKQRKEFGLRMQGGSLPFEGVSDRQALLSLLRNAQGGIPFDYSPDENHYYRVSVLRQFPQEVLMFADVKGEGTLDGLVEKQLAQAYPDIRKKQSSRFTKEDGSWKPLKEVQNLVGAEVYSELLKKIEEEAKRYNIQWSAEEKDSLDVYAHHRFITYIQEAHKALASGCAEEGWIQPSNEISKQWRLVKEELTLKREEAIPLLLTSIFDEKKNSWSKLCSGAQGNLQFYHVVEQFNEVEDPAVIMETTRQLLSIDARRTTFASLLENMKDQKLFITIVDEIE